MLLIDVPLFFARRCRWPTSTWWRSARSTATAGSPQVPAVPDGDRHRAGRQQRRGPCSRRSPTSRSEFARTPKYGIQRDGDEWIGKKYRQTLAIQPLVELGLGLYFTATVFYALANGIYGTLPFLMLFQVGFLYMGIVSIVQQYAASGLVLKAEEAGGK